MAHLEDVAVFVSVVEHGSFANAARRLKLPPTTVSRRVRQLEEALGVRLLHRTTRTLALTEAGRRYFEACSVGLEKIDAADRTARDTQAEPSGTVRISAPVNFGVEFFGSIVADFLVQNPRVKTEILLSDERLDLVRARIDVALRTGALPDSSFVARRVGAGRRIFCASPAYLAQRGVPAVPEDLRHHDCIISGDSTEGASWTFIGPNGQETVAVAGRLAANVMSLAVAAAVAGLGIAQVPEGLAMPDVKAGRLVPVLGRFAAEGAGVYLIFPSSRQMSAAVRAFIDHVGDWAARRLNSETGAAAWSGNDRG
jgi:DNA-binding transcriptional LysR family regulator